MKNLTLFLAFLDLKTKKLDFLDLKMTVLGYIFQKKCLKYFTQYFTSILNFLSTFFLGMFIFFCRIPNKIPPAYYLFGFLDLISDFLDFLDLKIF